METIKTWRSFGGEQRVYRHRSESLGTDAEFALFVPPGAGNEPRPVLWFLSGLTCTWENATTKAGLQRLASEYGWYVVAPDTSPRGAGVSGEDVSWDFGTGAGFYVDATTEAYRANYRMYSYVTEELQQVVAGLDDVIFGPQAITGHSMGGHGALVLGLKRPELYASVSAFSPIVNPSAVPWGIKAFEGYLGSDRKVWRGWDACHLLGNAARPDIRVRIDQGQADSFLERELVPERFVAACKEAGQPLDFHLHAGYDHSYYFVASFLPAHFAHHATYLDL